MRITINLSIFFHDHRSLAKIFVNKNMKCIQDIEQHITDIFNIHNFYLKCDNQYLPPCENVHILNSDDLVWVVPENKEDVASRNEVFCAVNSPEISKKRKKKKKVFVEQNVDKDDADLPQLETKKPKKRKHQEITETPNVESRKFDNSKQHVKSKKAGNISTKDCINDEINYHLKDSGRDSLDNSPSEDSQNKNNKHVKTLVANFEHKTVNYANRFENIFKTDNEKRINIVKTIIISPQKTIFDGTANSNVNETSQQLFADECESNVTYNTNDVQEKDTKNDDCKLSVSSSAMDTISSMCCSIDNEQNVNVNRRKRKRTRTRKKRSSPCLTEFNTSFEQPVYNFVHKQVVVQTPKHLRFIDETATAMPEKGEVFVSVANNDPVSSDKQRDSANDVILINESVISDNVQRKEDKSDSNIITLEKTIDTKQIEECLAKQPITQHTEPRIGDVIAFKILRISENYTPEVSSPIVGKVMSYTPENKDIAFDVIYGQDQCSLPNGKFSLETDESNESNSKFCCSWNTLLEPRLVYP